MKENVELKPGTRWTSQVCETEIVIVRAGSGSCSLECGGHPMVPVGVAPAPGLELDPAFSDGAMMGKRFADSVTGVELLVTRSGSGSVALDGVAMEVKLAKPLPSSD
jgi:hypothetical protein